MPVKLKDVANSLKWSKAIKKGGRVRGVWVQ